METWPRISGRKGAEVERDTPSPARQIVNSRSKQNAGLRTDFFYLCVASNDAQRSGYGD